MIVALVVVGTVVVAGVVLVIVPVGMGFDISTEFGGATWIPDDCIGKNHRSQPSSAWAGPLKHKASTLGMPTLIPCVWKFSVQHQQPKFKPM